VYADDPEMAELLVYFVGELQHCVDRLTQAWQSASHDDLRILAHQIRGAAGGYGFPTVTSSAAELEQALLSDETQVALLKEKVEDLIALCRRAASGA
jgi:HPt (histidine-containing phosphotransfer) domain-containing protein